MSELYRLEKKDAARAGEVLADAFWDNAVWGELLRNFDMKRRAAYFEGAIRYCMEYGDVFAPSEELEGVVVTIPGEYARMSFIRVMKTLSIKTVFKTNMKLLFKMKEIFDPLEDDRDERMSGKDYLYFMIVGVKKAHQGQGLGSQMMSGIKQLAKQRGRPIYLETSEDKNVKMYQQWGFRIIHDVTLPVINLPMYQMLLEE